MKMMLDVVEKLRYIHVEICVISKSLALLRVNNTLLGILEGPTKKC